ncbi:hypothetical protein LMH87_000189 [Akanthomyces muscarius]|uniref:Uncharacterized protein n=1 Tax=Akanthomyces muscarius TaxID=2231603 RepID=A0A9W8QHF5_AKAMU|nr:hypothetical protein LMH87_000189 [Akanthomyces muscarius]KAJ4154918.1 hypothetical protein LMH87_000189 [Akanthomyces muscarius]
MLDEESRPPDLGDITDPSKTAKIAFAAQAAESSVYLKESDRLNHYKGVHRPSWPRLAALHHILDEGCHTRRLMPRYHWTRQNLCWTARPRHSYKTPSYISKGSFQHSVAQSGPKKRDWQFT